MSESAPPHTTRLPTALASGPQAGSGAGGRTGDLATRRPSSLWAFVARVLAVFAVWYVVYDLWLLPDGRLDHALSHAVAARAGDALSLVGFETQVSGRVLRVGDARGVEVIDGCNGLTTLGLFVGFVLAYPGSWRRRAWFIPAGIAFVAFVNVLRVASLAAIQLEAPALFDLAHRLGVNTVFYAAVFALWVLWARLNDGTPSLHVMGARPVDATLGVPRSDGAGATGLATGRP